MTNRLACMHKNEVPGKTLFSMWDSPSPLWDSMRCDIRRRLAAAHALQPEHETFTNANNYLRKLRVGVRVRPQAEQVLVDVRVRQQAEQAKRLREQQLIVFQGSEEFLATIPQWKQADESLATEEKLRERQALKRAESIRCVTGAFWGACMRTAGFWTERTDALGGFSELLVTREAYECIFLRVYKVLLPEWDMQDAVHSVGEDWESDCAHGEPGLDFGAFSDALFEIADLWVPVIDAGAYARFLLSLFRKVTEGDSESHACWRDLETCAFDEELVDTGTFVQELEDAARIAKLKRRQAAGELTPAELIELQRLEDKVHATMQEGGRMRQGCGEKGRRSQGSKALRGQLERRTAGKKLQATARGYHARREKKARARALVTIQAGGRGSLGRNRARLRRSSKRDGHVMASTRSVTPPLPMVCTTADAAGATHDSLSPWPSMAHPLAPWPSMELNPFAELAPYRRAWPDFSKPALSELITDRATLPMLLSAAMGTELGTSSRPITPRVSMACRPVEHEAPGLLSAPRLLTAPRPPVTSSRPIERDSALVHAFAGLVDSLERRQRRLRTQSSQLLCATPPLPPSHEKTSRMPVLRQLSLVVGDDATSSWTSSSTCATRPMLRVVRSPRVLPMPIAWRSKPDGTRAVANPLSARPLLFSVRSNYHVPRGPATLYGHLGRGTITSQS